MAVIIPEYNSIFVHIPKTGGSSIQEWLLNNTAASHTAKGNKHHNLDRLESIYGKFDFSFAVVRNPWDWCVSWYFFRRDRALRRIRSPRDKGKFSFEYNQYVLNEFDKGFDYFLETTSLKPQFDKTLGVDYIIKLENINQDIKFLKQKFNIKHDLPYVNQSNRDKNYKQYYNSNTIKIVEEKFSKDITEFNYTFD